MTEASAEVAGLAYKSSLVMKISLGEIRHVHGGRRDLKFLSINGGVKAVVRGNGSVHHVYIYTNSPKEVVRLITEEFRVSP